MKKRFVIHDLQDIIDAAQSLLSLTPDGTPVNFWHRRTGLDEGSIILELYGEDEETTIAITVE